MPLTHRQLIIFVSRLLLVGLLPGCGSPEPGGMETPPTGRPVSVQYLKERYRGWPLKIIDDISLRAQVVSNDAEGQFSRSLYVQDATGAIELKIALTPSHEHYPPGQWITVRCAGLTLGNYGGSLQLGATTRDVRYETGFIATDDLPRHLVTYGWAVEIPVPAALSPAEFTMRWAGCLVQVADVEFIAEESGLTWGGAHDYTTRHAIPASTGGSSDTLAVRTAPEAAFAGQILPRGAVTLTGILTCFARRYELVVIAPPQ